MKQRYIFSDGAMFDADAAGLLAEYKQNEQLLRNYEELFCCMEDAEYVARGNGFCDSKYSEDFIDSQAEKYRRRRQQLETWMRAAQATKTELRSMIRAMKRARSAEELDAQSQVLMRKLEARADFQGAHRVMLYSALPDEVRTAGVIDRWRERKQIVLPTVVGDDIVPVALNADTRFEVGCFDITEPRGARYDGGYDLIVVPGMAFDAAGNRLGRGKGYYDRFLAQHPGVPTVGVCFDFQRVAHVPTEPTDVPMTAVL
jgi:5-formyltetrahydrofolate cyclo-ligase